MTSSRDQFFRVAFGTRPGTAIVISDTAVTIVDIDRSEHTETVLLELTGHDRVFTCLEKTALARGATYTCICTTYEIMWIDECKVGAPALSWKHDYGAGRGRELEVTVIHTERGGA